MADTSRAVLRYVPETAWGTTPAAALKTLRTTSFDLVPETETVVSEEIRPDRQVSRIVRTMRSSRITAGFEASYGTFDEILELALMGSWATDVLTNGTADKSATFEAHYTDVNEFIWAAGARLDTLSLNIEPGAIITGEMTLLGRRGVPAGATVGTGSPVAATTTQPLNAVENMTLIQEGGVAVAVAMGVTLNISNNLRVQPVIASEDPFGIGAGRIEVTGNVRAYFLNRTLLEKYTNFTASSLKLEMTDEDDNKLTITLPALRYTTGSAPVPGHSQDVIVDLGFTAHMDADTQNTIHIEREDGSP